ncbi:MAG: hypothetical protein V7709_09495 [Halioglobus sp.]
MTDDSEGTPKIVLTAMIVAALVTAQLVASRALRDGFFLTHFDTAQIPVMVISSALLSLLVALTSTHMLRDIAPARSMPWIFCVSATVYIAEWALSFFYPHVAAVILYLHVMSLGLLVASGYWSVVSERFDPHTAKRFIGRIGGGATLGGVLGGASAWWSAGLVEVPTMIFALAALNFGCALGVYLLGRGTLPKRRRAEPPKSAIAILRKTPYLCHLGLLVGLAAFCQACYDYVFKARVAESFATGSELVSFFALFYMGLNVVTFVLQNSLTKRLLEKYGLSFTVASLPGSGLITGAVALISPGLTSAVFMRGGIGAVENSMFRSGYELLYTPVLPEKKRPTKTVIDVGGEMSGAVLGGGAALAILAIAPNSVSELLIVAGMLASIGAIFVTKRIKLGYVSSLAESLKTGYADLEEMEMEARRQMYENTDIGSTLRKEASIPGNTRDRSLPLPPVPTRSDMMKHIFARRAALGSSKALNASQPFKPGKLRLPPEQAADDISVAILYLRSGSEADIRKVLSRMNPLPSELFSHVVPLLENPGLADLAAKTIRAVAPRHLGALLDAVRLEINGMPMRRKICQLLGQIPNQRCADGLINLLTSPDFELRFRVAESLLKVHRKNPELKIAHRRIFSAAKFEAQQCRLRWQSRAALDPRINRRAPLDSAQGQRVIQGFTYITTLLLTVLDSQPTSLAIRSLAHRSAAHRGTGLEYLQNVLPAPLLRELRPLLEDRRLALGTVKARSDILVQLTNERGNAEFDLRELRQRLAGERHKKPSQT